jgi:hypothetical protein
MIVELRKPVSIDRNDFGNFAHDTYPATDGQSYQRVNKGKVDDHYAIGWENTVAPLPDEPTVEADFGVWEVEKQAKKDKQPNDPTDSKWVFWVSLGDDGHNDGDLLAKVTNSLGETKTKVISLF